MGEVGSNGSWSLAAIESDQTLKSKCPGQREPLRAFLLIRGALGVFYRVRKPRIPPVASSKA